MPWKSFGLNGHQTYLGQLVNVTFNRTAVTMQALGNDGDGTGLIFDAAEHEVMATVNFAQSAQTDLLEAWLCIAEENLNAADRVLDTIE